MALAACNPKTVENTMVGAAAGAVAGQVIWDKGVEGAIIGGSIGAAAGN